MTLEGTCMNTSIACCVHSDCIILCWELFSFLLLHCIDLVLHTHTHTHTHTQRQQLIRLGVPSLFIAVALDKGPGPPMRSPYTDLTKLYAVVSILVRCCDNTVLQKSLQVGTHRGGGGEGRPPPLRFVFLRWGDTPD